VAHLVAIGLASDCLRAYSALELPAMSLQYASVKWNRNKLTYDGLIVLGVSLYLCCFVLLAKLVWPGSIEVIMIRALGTCALLMLHVALCIGPLARFDHRFLPVLYNRRHLGVATFLVGLAHALLALGYYHGFGVMNPFLSLLASNTNYLSLAAFPFEILGLIALVIMFLMAATSHDFWLKNLSSAVWKSLHMLIYLAYVLLIWHVALGALQTEASIVYILALGVGVLMVTTLHLVASWKEQKRDRAS
jgi:DMSO/TMAO reductase YedYZ heme-binding membrane subunit